jgi:hypothetical protein
MVSHPHIGMTSSDILLPDYRLPQPHHRARGHIKIRANLKKTKISFSKMKNKKIKQILSGG